MDAEDLGELQEALQEDYDIGCACLLTWMQVQAGTFCRAGHNVPVQCARPKGMTRPPGHAPKHPGRSDSATCKHGAGAC